MNLFRGDHVTCCACKDNRVVGKVSSSGFGITEWDAISDGDGWRELAVILFDCCKNRVIRVMCSIIFRRSRIRWPMRLNADLTWNRSVSISIDEDERKKVYARSGETRYGGAATGNRVAGRPREHRAGTLTIVISSLWNFSLFQSNETMKLLLSESLKSAKSIPSLMSVNCKQTC